MATRLETAALGLALIGLSGCKPSPETYAEDQVHRVAEELGCRISDLSLDAEGSILPLKAEVRGQLSCAALVTVDDILATKAADLTSNKGLVLTSEGVCDLIPSAEVSEISVSVGFIVDCI